MKTEEKNNWGKGQKAKRRQTRRAAFQLRPIWDAERSAPREGVRHIYAQQPKMEVGKSQGSSPHPRLQQEVIKYI